MKTPRWIEQPRILALLTLAFALVPVGFAFVTFRSARERDARLYESAAEVLGEQFKMANFRHINLINILRNQWRFVTDYAKPPATAQLPQGWQKRLPHLRGVAFASHVSEQHIEVRWAAGPAPMSKVGDNLASDALLADALQQARMTPAAVAFGAQLDRDLLAIVEAVPSGTDNSLVRGYMIGWLDVGALCRDQSLPLLKSAALQAQPGAATAAALPGVYRVTISGEGEVRWQAHITRGPGFSREYGTPTPWIGFAALGLSAVPLSLLVMLATRAGKLRAALDAERELGRMKNHFVSSVSHEFRTPLSVILSGAELLEAHAGQLSESRRQELLTQIKSSTGRMNEMVEQVLLLGRIESGAMKANPQPVDVAALCREIVEEVQIATQRRCEIVTKLDTGMRSLDVTLMRSVLANLLTNAVKYSRPGGRVIFEANESSFRVNDEGIGIPPADLARLGEPFHRASNVGDISGTGLGLAVVKRCVALCGGTFTIHSEEGHGTQVVVTLPT
ncbi:MAG: HAMP domain-containing sensor histidine kinase [Verrucomicrobia bacterium]|nr:HAMP domain-containing sensor histidine kinase [Verrucomicrobiota bacterium]